MAIFVIIMPNPKINMDSIDDVKKSIISKTDIERVEGSIKVKHLGEKYKIIRKSFFFKINGYTK